MSIEALNWAIKQNEIQLPSQRLVLLVLANYANSMNVSYPSIKRLAQVCSMSERTALRCIEQLEELGYLARNKRRSERGTQMYNVYTLLTGIELDTTSDFSDLYEQTDKLSVGPTDTVSTLQTDTVSAYPKDRITKEKNKKEATQNEDVLDVFNYWKETFNHPKATLDKKRSGRILLHLKNGFGPDDLKAACRGAKLSPWHMGENPTQTVYDKIDTVLRDSDQVEHFIALSKKRVHTQAVRVAPQVSTECVLCSDERKCQYHDPSSDYHTKRRAKAYAFKNI